MAATFPFTRLPPEQRGELRRLDLVSTVLDGNPWDDPVRRDVLVYLPRAAREEPARRFPGILLLPGFSGNGDKMLNTGLDRVDIATRLDHLVASGACAPFVAVMPDGFSSLGGTQYVDSHGIGSYARYLTTEVLPFVDAGAPTTGRWGVAGTSSGGFGALHLAMNHPGRFEAVACHAGDMGFSLCYLGDVHAAVGPLRAAGGPMAFVRALWERGSIGKDFAALNLLCMSAAYVPGPFRGPDGFPAPIPVDPVAGTVDFGVIESWSPFDPVVAARAPEAQAALSELGLLWIDVGDADEYHLQLGARRFAAVLREAGVGHRYSEWPGGHRSLSHRYDTSLPALADVLSG